MAGLSGLDEFINGLNEWAESAEKLNDVRISIDPTDSVTSVMNKLREEIRRSGAMELPEPTLQDIAQKKLDEARSHFASQGSKVFAGAHKVQDYVNSIPRGLQLDIYSGDVCLVRVPVPEREIESAKRWAAERIFAEGAMRGKLYFTSTGDDTPGSGDLVTEYSKNDGGWTPNQRTET